MSDNNSQNNETTERGWSCLKQHIISHKVEVALWATRIFTMLFTIGYFIPFFGNPINAYYKALMSNAATSALRLHQRIPVVAFTREFLAQLMLEDSCHYLLFSLIFLYVAPVTLVLLPVALFALLHSASYSLTLLDVLGQNSWWGARLIISLVEFQSRNILRLIALSEIFLMPLAIFFILMGRASLLTPFIYYHFLTLRYNSARNPYTRNMFHELCVAIQGFASKPGVPRFITNAVNTVINIICRLAPPQRQQMQ